MEEKREGREREMEGKGRWKGSGEIRKRGDGSKAECLCNGL